MSIFAEINLAELAAPTVVEPLNFEVLLAELKADLVLRAPGLAEVLDLESEPLVKLMQAFAYREMLLRARINDAAKSVLLAYALGSDLDNLAALMGVVRQTLVPADPAALPPRAAVREGDASLRRRVQLAPEGATAAGTEGAYLFYALAADARVADASVIAPQVGSGRVEITILARSGDGAADAGLLAAVEVALEPTRVLTDLLEIRSARPVPFQVTADLVLFPGPSAEVVLAAAHAALDDYLGATRRLGHDVTISGLHRALHQPGVQNVHLAAPAADVVCAYNDVAWCTGVTITGDTRDV